MGYDWGSGVWLTPEEEAAKLRNAALGGGSPLRDPGLGPMAPPPEALFPEVGRGLAIPPMPTRGAVNGYGEQTAVPDWQGYTLNDLLDHAAGKPAVSSVPEGRTGYGLDEVGDASVYHKTSKPVDWKALVGGALAGSASTRPGDGWASIGSGFLGGTAYQNDQEAQTRRNALTDSQVAHQGAENDLIGLKILDYPTERAREAEKAALDQELGQKRGSLLDEQIRNLVSGEQRDAEMHPLDMDSEKALAEQRRRPRSSGGSGLDPDSKDYRLELRTRIATLQRMKAAAEREYDHDTADSLGEQINELLNEQARVMEGLHGAPEPGPFPTLTADPIYAAPPAQRADPLDPQPGETAQQYADRVGPQLGKEARVRWQKAHP